MDLDSLFSAVAADTKGQAISPTVGSTEWTQWLSWANEELHSHGEVHDWPENKHLNYPVSSLSGTSLALPNFKKMAGYPIVNGIAYTEVDADQFDKYSSTAPVFRTGFDNGGYIEFKQSIISATGCVPFIGYHSTLATSTDKIFLRNPYYLVKRLKVRVFKYRQDPIFTEIESEAEVMLQQMLENEYYKHSQYQGGATTPEEDYGFSLGED